MIPSIISNFQSAFISSRQILDSVLIANECVDSCFRTKRFGVLCKLDLEKAYNNVDGSFLDYMLNRLGFGKNG
ncbi:hypothetical protein PJP07_31385, partial [Mycobacterium kansasii]